MKAPITNSLQSPQSAIRNPQSAIVIAGTSSNTGKTTLLCDLLRELGREESWEAIKLTRGHYRSCGKDPHACCVSHLLSDRPLVRSGRDQTYAAGKDTGHYWEAGASDVHWVIATDNQVEQGIRTALDRVKSGRVLIEGTSLLKFIEADFVVMVTRPAHLMDQMSQLKIKPSARRALAEGLVDAIYLSSDDGAATLKDSLPPELTGAAPIYTCAMRQQLISVISSQLSSHRSISLIPQTPEAY
jgi:molybdopterin-guanine dinucleotide biosynthesis protein